MFFFSTTYNTLNCQVKNKTIGLFTTGVTNLDCITSDEICNHIDALSEVLTNVEIIANSLTGGPEETTSKPVTARTRLPDYPKQSPIIRVMRLPSTPIRGRINL